MILREAKSKSVGLSWHGHIGGGKYNAELKRLMLDHAFRFVEIVIFKIGPTNFRSRKAVEKIGGVLTERREEADLHRRTVDHVVYQIKKPTKESN